MPIKMASEKAFDNIQCMLMTDRNAGNSTRDVNLVDYIKGICVQWEDNRTLNIQSLEVFTQ